MSKPRTADLPDLALLREPPDAFALEIQTVLLRRSGGGLASLSLPEQIAARIAGLIALDRIRPGQRILEEDVSAVLGVSRAPVREALRMLERDRMLHVRPRHGAQVSLPTARELHDIFEVRASLWGTLLEHVYDASCAELEASVAAGLPALAAAVAADDADAYARASFRMTNAVSRLCTNELLRDMVQSVALQTVRYARLGFAQSGEMARSLREWRRMARAVRVRDRAGAIALARARIAGSRNAALRALAHDPNRPDGASDDPAPDRPNRRTDTSSRGREFAAARG
jgi:DNA-binding GntR family transcriptional regulator